MLPSELWVFDNAVLSNFARIGRLELLLNLPIKICTTREVLEEAERGIRTKPKLKKIMEYSHADHFQVMEAEREETILWMAKLRAEGALGMGEISVMGVCKEWDGIFVTDDEVATRKARQAGVKTLHPERYHGTVIILEMLEKAKIINEKILSIIKSELNREGFCC